MRTYELDSATARRLAEEGASAGPVLTLYLDLDPSEFATPQARSTAIRSLLDDAGRQVSGDERGHDEQEALKESLEQVREVLEADLPADGAAALAIFCSSRSGLLDVVKLPRPVPSRAIVNDAPFIEPLVSVTREGDWCVVLVNRRAGRIFRGGPDRLEELERIEHDTHGQHDQGGWSQARYERSVEKEVADHLAAVFETLLRRFKARPFDHLLIGCPQELAPDVEGGLHPYLRERLAGRIEIDVENTGAGDVARAAAPLIEEHERERERSALERLVAGAAQPGGRGAAGLDAVLEALSERRVEILLLAAGFAAPGVSCPACGWLGREGIRSCPADGTQVDVHDDLSERMVGRALEQTAEVMVVRHHSELGPMGGVGAVLRF